MSASTCEDVVFLLEVELKSDLFGVLMLLGKRMFYSTFDEPINHLLWNSIGIHFSCALE